MLCRAHVAFFFSSEIFLNSKQRLTNPSERRIEWKSKCSMKSLETIAIKVINDRLSQTRSSNRSYRMFLHLIGRWWFFYSVWVSSRAKKPVIKRRSCCVRDARWEKSDLACYQRSRFCCTGRMACPPPDATAAMSRVSSAGGVLRAIDLHKSLRPAQLCLRLAAFLCTLLCAFA